MISYLKEKLRIKSKTFFTSDLHFGHANVINYCKRPFKDKFEMNEAMIKVWNETVKDIDTVWILGDFSLNPKLASEIALRLNGTKYLVSGNHDSCFIGHNKWQKMKTKYMDNGFDVVFEHLTEIKLKDDTHVLLSHLPYLKLDHDQRYKEYRPDDKGSILLCGHLHGRFIKNDRIIDVGWDAHNGKILSEDDIIAIINDKREFIPSHLTDWYLEKDKIV